MAQIPWKLVNWPNSLFMFGTLFLALLGLPAYWWYYGLDTFQLLLFLFFFAATGLSITLGYHRLFSHRSFKASWPVRIFTLLFGAAAFENSVLIWAADHRRHHKFVDHEEDPYDISQGFWHAHIGWILFRLKPDSSLDVVKDLQQDALVRWQHRHYLTLGILMGFGLPALLGGLWNGWIGALGGFLFAGVTRLVCVHHMTFLINSLCHTFGNQPYSSHCTARDSALMALFTFGEGYHNFHHAFQHDYRNGVKPWQFDPTKWAVWVLYKLGLVDQLRRVPEEKIRFAEIAEQERQLELKLQSQALSLAPSLQDRWQAARQALHTALRNWEHCEAEYRRTLEMKLASSRERLSEIQSKFHEARAQFHTALQEWWDIYYVVNAQLAV